MLKNEMRLSIKEILDIDTISDNYCEHWGMVCVTKGELTVTCGNRVYRLVGGTAAFFAPGEFHYIREPQSAEYIFFSFTPNGDMISNLAGAAVEITEDEMLLLKKINRLKYSDRDTVDEQLIYTMLELFLLCCCKKDYRLPSLKQKNAIIFSKAADILSENISSQITVSDLAERLGVSLSNLKRIFALYTDIGVHEYHTILKTAQAKELLSKGVSVTATAELTGFANQAYFSAAFKKITGITPKEYARNRKAPRAKTAVSTKQPAKSDLPSYLL